MIIYCMLNKNKILLTSATIYKTRNNHNDYKIILLLAFNDNIHVQHKIIYCRNL